MPIWLLVEGTSKYPNGTAFMLDCDACGSCFGVCDSDITGSAPMSELPNEIDSTDWQVIQSHNPAVTTEFICPGCQAMQLDSVQLRLPDVTPERSSPFERMKSAGEMLEVCHLQRWRAPEHTTDD
jgi:ferredoxin